MLKIYISSQSLKPHKPHKFNTSSTFTSKPKASKSNKASKREFGHIHYSILTTKKTKLARKSKRAFKMEQQKVGLFDRKAPLLVGAAGDGAGAGSTADTKTASFIPWKQ